MPLYIVTICIESVIGFECSCRSRNDRRQIGIYSIDEYKPHPCRKERIDNRLVSCVPCHIKTKGFVTIIILALCLAKINMNLWRFIKCGFLEEPHNDLACFCNAISKAEPITNTLPIFRQVVLARYKDLLDPTNYIFDNDIGYCLKAISYAFCDVCRKTFNAFRNATNPTKDTRHSGIITITAFITPPSVAVVTKSIITGVAIKKGVLPSS